MTERSIGAAIALLAARDPDAAAVVDAATGAVLTRAALRRESTRWARAWADRVDRDDLVVLALPNGPGFVVAAVAVWTLGATPVPVAPDQSPADRAAVLDAVARETGRPPLVVDVDTPPPGPEVGDEPLPDAWARAWKAPASGGSTGRPKIVVSTGPARVDPDADVAPYLPRDQVQLVAGPLHHSAPFTYAMRGLMTGHTLVVLPRFSPGAVLDAIAAHRVSWALLVPTMLHRLRRHPGIDGADLSSLATLVHLGAPCPEDLKRWWIDRLGPTRVVEVYASSESAGITMITGDEWLAHPGSVGRPVGGSSFRVVGPDGVERPAGATGEVIMTRSGGPRYRYLGAEPRRIAGWEGWDALGDLGWLDAEGYLYLVDRAADTLDVGGTPVYPARVEAALEAHPAVRSCAVVGRDGAVHALLDLDGAASPGDVLAWARSRLAPEEVPASAEAVGDPLRDDAGKVNRRALGDADPPPSA